MKLNEVLIEDAYDNLQKTIDNLQARYLKDLQKIAMKMFGVEWNKIKDMSYEELDTFLRKIDKERK